MTPIVVLDDGSHKLLVQDPKARRLIELILLTIQRIKMQLENENGN
jgi:hypothetical protein